MFPKVVIVFLSPYRQCQKNFPFIVGKNGCFILLIAAIIDGECSAYSVAKSCLTLCNPMDWSLPGSPVHGISQARILEWVAISYSEGSFRGWTQISYIPCIGWQILCHCTTWEAPLIKQTYKALASLRAFEIPLPFTSTCLIPSNVCFC